MQAVDLSKLKSNQFICQDATTTRQDATTTRQDATTRQNTSTARVS